MRLGLSSGLSTGGFVPSVSPIEPTTLNPYLYFNAGSNVTTSGGSVSTWYQITHSEGNQISTYLSQGTANEQPQHDSSDNHVTYDSSDDHLDFYSTTITQAGTLVSATSNGIWAFDVNTNSQTDVNALGYYNGFAFAVDQYALILFPTLTDAELAGVVLWLEQNTNATKTASGSLFNYNRVRSEITKLRAEGLDTSSATGLVTAWFNCSSMTSFPSLDTSSVTNFSYAWYGCSSLTSFPSLDVSSGTNFSLTWKNCSSLTSFPSLDTSSGTNFQEAWMGCSSLTSFPSLDTSSGTTFQEAWRNCTSLTSFPSGVFDSWNPSSISSGVFNVAWDGCSDLTATSVENILTSLATSGKHGTDDGTSGGSALADAVIDIDYDTGTGSLTTATNTAITTLKSRSWGITINGVAQ